MSNRLRRAVFSIRSTATDPESGDEPEVLDIRADGYVRSDANGAVVFNYHEETEGQRTRCTVTAFADGAVTVLREGASQVRFVFEPGGRYETVYSVGAYCFDAEVETEQTHFTKTAAGGALTLRYRLKIGGVLRYHDFSLSYSVL